jgi:hypothetical protein
LLTKFIFSDEAAFHINRKVNWRDIHVWGTENPDVTLKHERDSPKMNVLCVISEERVYGPFFFVVNSVVGNSYLDMLTLWHLP